MAIVVADAGPPRYLVLIDQIELLPRLYGSIVMPYAVHDELTATRTPALVRAWVASAPPWLELRPAPVIATPLAAKLDAGEQAAIAIAMQLGAALILMDDRAGVAEAHRRGLQATGTLGVLLLAARRGFIDFEAAIARLTATNFRYSPALLAAVLAAWRQERGG